MSYTTISLSHNGPAAIITFARPERRNAISAKMIEEIIDACEAAGRDPEIRSLIVTGGPDCFSAGMDLTEALEVKTPEDRAAFFARLHRLNSAVETIGKPVIAAIEGFCYTGGCEFALACDIRIAGDGATFAITSARIGTIAGAGGTQRLPRLVGAANAMAMLFSADPIDAGEAFRIGLINKKTARGEALEAALSLAATYAERAPLSLALTKKAVRQGLDLDLETALKLEIDLVSKIYGTADKQEGISAFLEKRTPRFQGR
jgi:enoyl-CoA hydratase/carnithine racemase